MMRTLLVAAGLLVLAGCAAFEQSPDDVQKKLAEPTKGQFYERDPLEGY